MSLPVCIYIHPMHTESHTHLCLTYLYVQFAILETVMTAVQDTFPHLRQKKTWVVLCVSLLGFLGGLVICSQVSCANISLTQQPTVTQGCKLFGKCQNSGTEHIAFGCFLVLRYFVSIFSGMHVVLLCSKCLISVVEHCCSSLSPSFTEWEKYLRVSAL